MSKFTKGLATVLLGLGLLVLAGCGNADERAVKKGLKAITRQQFDEALMHLGAVLDAKPEHPQRAELLNYMGLAYWHLDRVEEANEAFHASREANPDLFAPAYNLGLLFLKAGDLYQGAALLEDAALIRSTDERPLEMLAAQYLKQEDYTRAVDILKKALQQNPGSARLTTYLAVAGLQSQGADFAEDVLQKAVKLDGSYAPARFNLGVLYEKWHREPEQAIEYYKQYLDVEPDEIRRKLISAGVTKLIKEQEALKKAVVEEPADDPMRAATPEELETPQLPSPAPEVETSEEVEDVPAAPLELSDEARVDRLLAKAVQEIRDGSSTRAMHYCLQAAAEAERLQREDLHLKALQSAVSLLPDQPRAHFALGRFLNDQGKCPQALKAFQRCVELNPKWAQGHLSLAECAITCHEYQIALEALRETVELEPENEDAQWALALFYETQIKLPDRALAAYRTFMTRFPGDARATQAGQRVSSLSKQGGNNEGFDVAADPTPTPPPKPVAPSTPQLRHSLTAITPVNAEANSPGPSLRTLTPRAATDDVRARPASEAARSEAVQRYNQGTVQQREGQFDKALNYYQQAVQMDPIYAPPYYNMGVIYQRQNKLNSAMEAYRESLKSRPDLINARYNLGLIFKELKQYDEAVAELERVLQFNRNHAPSHFALGLIYEQQGNIARTREHYQRFLALSPTDPASPRVRRWMNQH